MNLDKEGAVQLLQDLVKKVPEDPRVQKILFPPFLYLESAIRILGNRSDFFIGAQNCHHLSQGAYTGEVHASALKSLGVTHIIIGHSERRMHFLEKNEHLLQKLILATNADLTPVFCIGENLTERKGNQFFATIGRQLNETIFRLRPEMAKRAIIAYEPVWAIGTGESATPEMAQEMHAYIRLAFLEKLGVEAAAGITILYGGSCNADNAKSLFACDDIDGGLIGGASLNADSFSKISSSFGPAK